MVHTLATAKLSVLQISNSSGNEKVLNISTNTMLTLIESGAV